MYTGLKEQLDFGNNLISQVLPINHELVNLKMILDWEKMNEIYKECYNSKKGNATKGTDLVLGLLILKHLYQKSYRDLISDLHVNNAYMHFCSVSYEEIKEANEKNKSIICPSALVKIKNRLGAERIKRIEKIFLSQLIKKNIVQGKYMFGDTTSLEKNILFPTEVSLLKRVIEESEMVIQKVKLKKQMVKNEVIKKANQIAKKYYSTSKKTKELLNKCTKDLLEIAHNAINKAEKTAQKVNSYSHDYVLNRYEKLEEVGKKIIAQTEIKLSGEKVPNKIVSYYEEHARSLPKGKTGKPVEFGDKLRLEMTGNGYITNYKLYIGNVGDVTMLEEAVREHAEVFKDTFKGAGFDRGFYDEALIEKLENKHKIQLAIPHKKNREEKVGKIKQKLNNKRSAIEAKISEGKRKCGLNKSLYKGFEGDQCWTTLSILSLNIRKLMRDISKNPKLMSKFQNA